MKITHVEIEHYRAIRNLSIDLHLNPVWHRMLVPLLRKYSPGTQFFIASHSPAIWDSVYSSQRVFLKNGEIVNEEVVDNG